jgi:hypothetical protein
MLFYETIFIPDLNILAILKEENKIISSLCGFLNQLSFLS